jgi:hypothetical protein
MHHVILTLLVVPIEETELGGQTPIIKKLVSVFPVADNCHLEHFGCARCGPFDWAQDRLLREILLLNGQKNVKDFSVVLLLERKDFPRLSNCRCQVIRGQSFKF